jgi:hypothetical protein
MSLFLREVVLLLTPVLREGTRHLGLILPGVSPRFEEHQGAQERGDVLIRRRELRREFQDLLKVISGVMRLEMLRLEEAGSVDGDDLEELVNVEHQSIFHTL